MEPEGDVAAPHNVNVNPGLWQCAADALILAIVRLQPDVSLAIIMGPVEAQDAGSHVRHPKVVVGREILVPGQARSVLVACQIDGNLTRIPGAVRVVLVEDGQVPGGGAVGSCCHHHGRHGQGEQGGAGCLLGLGNESHHRDLRCAGRRIF